MASGWLEERTRIPLAGIVAMVLIVAVVAFFMRAQLNALFPESTVAVSDAASEDANVRGSASFAGEREVQLIYKQRYEGVLTTSSGSIHFSVDVPEGVLVLTAEDLREEILLDQADDGGALAAVFEYDRVQTSVRIDPAARELTFADGGLTTRVALSDVVVYEGVFTHAGKRYLFQLVPDGDALVIGQGESARVTLTSAGEALVGTWYEGKEKHPVHVDTKSLIATIGELW